MKKRALGGVAVLSSTALMVPGVCLLPAFAAPDGSGIIINEIYTRGGSSGATYTHKYVELYNPSSAAIDLSDLTLGYSASHGKKCFFQGGPERQPGGRCLSGGERRIEWFERCPAPGGGHVPDEPWGQGWDCGAGAVVPY